MISKICLSQPMYNINFTHKSAEQNSKNFVTNPDNNSFINGANALANYNKILANKDRILDVKDITPILNTQQNLSEIDGEKIYSTDGKLASVVQETNDEKIIYTPYKNTDRIETIRIYDKNTNTVKKAQEFFFDDDNTSKCYDVYEFNEAGKESGNSYYINNKLSSSRKKSYDKLGREVSIVHGYDTTTPYSIYTTSKDNLNHTSLNFDYKKQLCRYIESKIDNHGRISKEACFNDGALVSIDEQKTSYVANMTGVEKLQNPDFVLHPLYNVISDAAKFEGEKTYYSNGALETNTFEGENGIVTYTFSPNGEIAKINDGNKEIIIDNGMSLQQDTQKIKEDLGNDKYRITQYSTENKPCFIEIQEGDNAKRVSFDEYTLKPKYYLEEKLIDGNPDNRELTMILNFNNDGMVVGH